MKDLRTAVIGIGATGAVLAAVLLRSNPETVLVDTRPFLEDEIKQNGIRISGEMDIKARSRHFLDSAEKLRDFNPDLIFVSTKTVHFPGVLDDLKRILQYEFTDEDILKRYVDFLRMNAFLLMVWCHHCG